MACLVLGRFSDLTISRWCLALMPVRLKISKGRSYQAGILVRGKFFKPDGLVWVVQLKEILTAKKNSRRALRSGRENFRTCGIFLVYSPATSRQKETAAPNGNHKPRRTEQKIPTRKFTRLVRLGTSFEEVPTKEIPTWLDWPWLV